MKHRVTNFGSDRLEIYEVGATTPLSLGPGASCAVEIDRIVHGPGRTHYSVRPAERARVIDDEDCHAEDATFCDTCGLGSIIG